MTQSDALTREIARAVERVRPILAGRPPEMQGAIISTLMAMWLAGHVAEDEDTTRALREDMLELHCMAVRLLVPLNAQLISESRYERR